MSVINDLIEQIENPELRNRIQQEFNKLNKQRKFGLVYEEHVPEKTFLYDVPVKRGSFVAKRDAGTKDLYKVIKIDGENALCEHTVSHEQETIAVDALVAVAQLGEPIYPYLKPMAQVKNAPDSELWHTLIEADNYHALQLLAYLYAGQVDCIYIDPPYNSGARDWKYNNDYVDDNDSYRHSKWLSMIEKRLQLAKKMLNPNNSVLIVTIDEKEYNHLGCLLEQMFPEARIQMISTVINSGGVARDRQFFRTDEYIYVISFGECGPLKLQLDKEWAVKADERASKVSWRMSLVRGGSNSTRKHSPGCFYPIFVANDGSHIVDIGTPLPFNIERDSVIAPEGSFAVWPLKTDGSEGCWQMSPSSLKEAIGNGYVRLGRFTERGIAISYLNRKEIEKAHSDGVEIIGRRPDNSIITNDSGFVLKIIPGTQWRIQNHNARVGGTNLLKVLGIDNRFSYPKSIYAVRDTLRFFVANTPDALILDFFAGSGTTLHAVNLLNAEDGGHRRCIMVTNNEIGEAKERELKPQGIRPGDEEWEKWGIARYVTWPRTECSIKGIDVNGNPIEGEYITTKTETKRSDRRFNQINFLTDAPTLKQKKAVVALINKQKTVKLPSMSEDTDFLLAEDDDSCNASILFDVTAIDEWKEALEGHDEITDLYVVTQKDALFRKIKTEVGELMGQIEESVPVTMPMKEGFKANAAYFKLGFLDKTSVALGRQFKELLPILWMKAGARGECPTIESEELPKMLICENNHFAVLLDEYAYPTFEKKVNEAEGIDIAYIVTDSDSGYKEMAQGLNVDTCYQLYRDYLDNFRINNIR